MGEVDSCEARSCSGQLLKSPGFFPLDTDLLAEVVGVVANPLACKGERRSWQRASCSVEGGADAECSMQSF